MTTDAGPTLSFPGWAWALLRDRGRYTRGRLGHAAILPTPDGSARVDWTALPVNERRALYAALVRATARCENRPERQWFADVLHRLGYELIPDTGPGG